MDSSGDIKHGLLTLIAPDHSVVWIDGTDYPTATANLVDDAETDSLLALPGASVAYHVNSAGILVYLAILENTEYVGWLRNLWNLSDDDLLGAHLDALAIDKANPKYNSTHPHLVVTRTEIWRRKVARGAY